ncbi:hypothetical protein T492DRAFT_856987 [Pavlovales sp. CCMP2436]|nr:hypothetical protein T492DRAFT_856987 [Pavlovales sp. CCMP2436]
MRPFLTLALALAVAGPVVDALHALRHPRSVLRARIAMTTAMTRPKDRAAERQTEPDTTREQRRIVLISGFESFNVALYKECAQQLSGEYASVRVDVFSDRDLSARRKEVDAALADADAFIGSLIFDYDDVHCTYLSPEP